MGEPLPRLLVIMGSGETSPTMSKVHRDVFGRLGHGAVPAVVLDTPFGFQENADDIAARAVAYFRESVGRAVSVASFRSADDIGTLEHETVLARLREARWVFSGPGSPSYAVGQWRDSQIPVLLADKLRTGGCVTFASAAAVTLGAYALPVYEIYKVGQRPHWIEGLDLLGAVGLRAAVIPHFNNAEGGNHDTRYCYMGERRLQMLEAQLPDDEFVLGVDEHTACIFDLDAGTATVAGLGGVTVRHQGEAHTLPSGTTVDIDFVRELALAASAISPPGAPAPTGREPGEPPTPLARSPLLDEVTRLEESFDKALEAGDAASAVRSILELDDVCAAWSRDTLESDELDRARAALRAMVVRLGEAAVAGLRDPRETVSPLVEALLETRRQARAAGRWPEADAIRDRLLAAGIEVRDTPAGTDWTLR